MLLFNDKIVSLTATQWQGANYLVKPARPATEEYKIGNMSSESRSITTYPMLEADNYIQEVQPSASGYLAHPVTKDVAIFTDKFMYNNGQLVPLFFKYDLPVRGTNRVLMERVPEWYSAQFFVDNVPQPTQLIGSTVYVPRYDISRPCNLQYTLKGTIYNTIPKLVPVLKFDSSPITSTANGFLLTTSHTRLWVSELARRDVIWQEDDHVCMSVGTYGDNTIGILYGAYDTDYSMRKASRQEYAKVSADGTYLQLARNPLVSITEIVAEKATINISEINYMAGRIYLNHEIAPNTKVTVTYEHIVREKVLPNPKLIVGDRSNSFIIGIVEPTSSTQLPTFYDGTDIKYCYNGRKIASTYTSIPVGTVVIKGRTDTIEFEQSVNIGGGVDNNIENITEVDFFMDIGFEDGPPVHGSKILQATLPPTVENKIAFQQLSLYRTQSNAVTSAMSVAKQMINEKLDKIKPAGAMYVEIDPINTPYWINEPTDQ